MLKPKGIISEHVVSKVLTSDELEMGTHYESCQIDRGQDSIKLNEMSFTKCIFKWDDWERAEVIDCIFKNCELSNYNFNSAYIHRSEFLSCKFLNTAIVQSNIKDCYFYQCLMQYVNFSDNKMDTVLFENTSLRECSFMRLKLKNIRYNQCNLDAVSFLETPLQGLDLTSSDFKSLMFSPDCIKGLCIRMDQAVQLIEAMGVVVE